jgi:hypothetical protein
MFLLFLETAVLGSTETFSGVHVYDCPCFVCTFGHCFWKSVLLHYSYLFSQHGELALVWIKPTRTQQGCIEFAVGIIHLYDPIRNLYWCSEWTMMTTDAVLPLQDNCTTVWHCMPCFGLSLFSVWPRLFGKPYLTFGWIFFVVHLIIGNSVPLSLWNMM